MKICEIIIFYFLILSKNMGGQKKRFYCVTSYKVDVVPAPTKARYCVFQGEVCPKTKRKHWQMYLEYAQQVSLTTVKKDIDDEKCHVEGANGTREQARNYCMDRTKETFTEVFQIGLFEAGGQGSRNDLATVCQMVKEKKTLRDIAIEYPVQYVKYSKGLEKLDFMINTPPEDRNVHVTYLWGLPGCGKSVMAHKGLKVLVDYYPMSTDKDVWFDCYTGQEYLLIDDPQAKFFTASWFKKLADRYPLILPTKGGHVWAKWMKVIITSEFSPEQLWINDRDYTMGVVRRINELKHFIKT